MDALDVITAEYPTATLVFLALLGACVGSFLNVVIYRLPRGLSVQKPARSFCPSCGAGIPWYLNIPLVSWLLLRGRSACCHKPIAVRYWLVEAVCTLLFVAIGYQFAYENLLTQLLMCLWGACMLALLAMDWELMVVETPLAWLAAGLGVAAVGLDPQLVAPDEGTPWGGMLWGVAGALGGYAVFRMVGLGGRLLFGRRSLKFGADGGSAWSLRQVGEDIVLSVAGQEFSWGQVFAEAGAAGIELKGAEVQQLPGVQGCLVLREDALLLPDGSRRSLEEFECLSGTCRALTVRREAMGSGDPWLAFAIGGLCGWQGVLFSLVGGSIIGLVMALVMRVRRGVPMPFGPALIMAALVWLFYGPQLWELYLNWLVGN